MRNTDEIGRKYHWNIVRYEMDYNRKKDKFEGKRTITLKCLTKHDALVNANHQFYITGKHHQVEKIKR